MPVLTPPGIGCLFAVKTLVEGVLQFLQMRCLRKNGNEIPREFRGLVDENELTRMQKYGLGKLRFGFWQSSAETLLLLFFIFSGLLAEYARWVESRSLGWTAKGILFFLGLVVMQTVWELPWDWARTFGLEKKFGFTTSTAGLWAMDQLKSTGVTLGLLAILAYTGLALIRAFPDTWWFWSWGFLLVFSIFMLYLSPYMLEPLFNRFRPLENESQVEDMRRLLGRAGLQISRVFSMDASRRSRHSNAYFSGVGRVKRIVLYDTLLKNLNPEEVLAVLAHEAGHWKRRHLAKFFFTVQAGGLLALWAAFWLCQPHRVAAWFGVSPDTVFVRLVLSGALLSIILFFFTPLLNFLSRRQEREADRFADRLLGNGGSLADALRRLALDNLANLHPHPWYAGFYYSHPPVLQRMRALRGEAGA